MEIIIILKHQQIPEHIHQIKNNYQEQMIIGKQKIYMILQEMYGNGHTRHTRLIAFAVEVSIATKATITQFHIVATALLPALTTA